MWSHTASNSAVTKICPFPSVCGNISKVVLKRISSSSISDDHARATSTAHGSFEPVQTIILENAAYSYISPYWWTEDYTLLVIWTDWTIISEVTMYAVFISYCARLSVGCCIRPNMKLWRAAPCVEHWPVTPMGIWCGYNAIADGGARTVP